MLKELIDLKKQNSRDPYKIVQCVLPHTHICEYSKIYPYTPMYNDIYLLLTLRQREKYMYKNILVGMGSYSWLLLSNGAFDSAKKG